MDVAIIKYNAGNIYSVSYALKRLGVSPVITADPELLHKADKVIFQGVGEAFTTMDYLKEHKLDAIIKDLKQPVLGICLGMQCIAIEFARNVLGYADANSREMDEKTPHNVIDIMEEQKAITNMGGTMRLGAYECVLQKGSKAYQAYGQEHIQERHRHRYEFNNAYIETFAAHGLRVAGVNPERNLVEAVELVDHPWFVGVQFHPEFKSRPNRAHPLFVRFVRAALEHGAENGR